MPATLDSFNPATGDLVGSVRVTTPEQVAGVVAQVARVQPLWAALPFADRSRYLRRAAVVILDELEDLRDLIVREQGKPRAEAYLMELVPTIDALRWIADHGPEILGGERIPMRQPYLALKRAQLVHEPLGVVAVIAPWNYPWSIPLGETAAALMAGNGVVLKPSSQTPLIGERIERLFLRAGLPEGIVRVIHGPGVGAALVESPVAKVFFTGSVDAGRDVGEACARRLKGAVLELGGKDPMLVLADAHLPHAVAGALWGGFANAGQTCAGIERIYVRREVAERFTAGLVDGARRLGVGDPRRWETQVGPMIDAAQRDQVAALVDEAVADGAILHCGGRHAVTGLRGAFFAPAVLSGVTPGMRIMREEIFGPVVPVVTVDTDEEAVALANDSRFGLGASVWTRDRHRGERIARELEAGMVWINDHLFSHGAFQCTWGGVKESGLGRTHGAEGLLACTSPKLVARDPGLARNLWWYPYDETLGFAVKAAAELLYGREADRRRGLREGALPLTQLARRTLRSAGRR